MSTDDRKKNGAQQEPCCDHDHEHEHGHAHGADEGEEGEDQELAWNPDEDDVDALADELMMHPWQARRIAEGSIRAHLAEFPEEPVRRPVVFADEVSALSTDDILERLGALGVVTNKAAFRDLAMGHTSAWDLSRAHWIDEDAEAPAPEDADFLGIAAVSFWKRWCGERPCFETLDDLLDEGYRAYDDDEDPVAALAPWTRFWRRLKPELGPEVREVAEMEDYVGPDDLLDWCVQYSRAAAEAAEQAPDTAPGSLSIVEEVLAQFAGDREVLEPPMAESLAKLRAATGGPS